MNRAKKTHFSCAKHVQLTSEFSTHASPTTKTTTQASLENVLQILLMVQKSGVHQLRLVVYSPVFTKVLAPSQVVVGDFFHQQCWRLPLP